MMHLVTGGSGSGKSSYAEEQILLAGGDRRIYIATMIPYGEEGRRRVERHRRLRKEKGFETIERYTDLAGLEIPDGCTALLECVSNLTANELFDPSGAGQDAGRAVTEGIARLNRQAKTLIVVTNEVFSDGCQYEASTVEYLACLGGVNRELARMADRVTEVVCGIALPVK